MNLSFGQPLAALGRATVQSIAGFGYGGMLLAESLWFTLWGWRRGQPVRLAAIVTEMRRIGVDALPIVCLLSLTIGIMLGIQFIAALKEFGAQSQVIVAVAKSVTRETSRLRNSSRARNSSSCAFTSLSSSRTSTSPRLTSLPSQSQISTMRSRIRLVTFAQRTGSTAPVA